MTDDLLTVTFTCSPGTVTGKRAIEFGTLVTDYLNALAEHIAAGEVTFDPRGLTWIDDGKDEIVVHVRMPEKTDGD